MSIPTAVNEYNQHMNIAVLGVRLWVGLFLASAMGIAFYLAGSFLAPRGALGMLAPILVVGSGAGASAGGVVSWVALQENRRIMALTALLALLGGFCGAWGGHAYGSSVYGYKVVPKTATVLSTVLGAAVGANILPFLASAVWSFRNREL